MSNKGRTGQAAMLTVAELVPKHIRTCISRAISYGSVVDGYHLEKAFGRHVWV